MTSAEVVAARRPPQVAPWILILAGWTLLGLFRGWQAHTNDPQGSLPYLLLINLVRLYTWAALTPLAIASARKRPPQWPMPAQLVLWHLGAALVLSLAQMALQIAVFHSLGFWYMTLWNSVRWLLHVQLHNDIAVYLMLAALVWGYDSSVRAQAAAVQKAHLEREFAEARLETLNTSLNPPFFFGTLNTILPLIYSDPGAAAQLVIDLGDLLRLTFKHEGRAFVRLADELDTLRLYLKIETTRFADRLRFTINADPAVADVPVPHLILQPFIAQAVAQGIARRVEASLLRITACRQGGRLLLLLEEGQAPEPADVEGPPWTAPELRPAVKRLMHLYGNDLSLTWNESEGGLAATLAVPFAPATLEPRPEGGTQ